MTGAGLGLSPNARPGADSSSGSGHGDLSAPEPAAMDPANRCPVTLDESAIDPFLHTELTATSGMPQVWRRDCPPKLPGSNHFATIKV